MRMVGGERSIFVVPLGGLSDHAASDESLMCTPDDTCTAKLQS